MDEPSILLQLSDEMVLALTAMAEAGGDSKEGGSSVEERIAVMCVVRNRLRTPGRWGDSYKTICLSHTKKTWQFDCWRPGSGRNHDRLIALAYLMITGQPLMNPLAEETLYLAHGVITGTILDRVNGATSYYAPKSMVPVNRVPKWARGVEPSAEVGSQRFYKNV